MCYLNKRTSKEISYYQSYGLFKNYFNKNLNIFNYFQICNEFQALKEILFEQYAKYFSNFKPKISLHDLEIFKEK